MSRRLAPMFYLTDAFEERESAGSSDILRSGFGGFSNFEFCLQNELISSERRFFEERESVGGPGFPFSVRY